jgi:hypothetical protein
LNLLSDPDELARLIEQNAPAGFMNGADAAAWLADPRHFALRQNDDLGLFEAGDEWPGPLVAHVLFRSRGKIALETAQAMLDQAFAYGATRILGETPERFPHALLFARLLGFVPYGRGVDAQGENVILSALNNAHPQEDRMVA